MVGKRGIHREGTKDSRGELEKESRVGRGFKVLERVIRMWMGLLACEDVNMKREKGGGEATARRLTDPSVGPVVSAEEDQRPEARLRTFQTWSLARSITLYIYLNLFSGAILV